MRLLILAVGRMRKGPEYELTERYFSRFKKLASRVGLGFDGVIEITESQALQREQRVKDEGEKLLSLMRPGSLLLILDEKGDMMSSLTFAGKLADLRDTGCNQLVVAIGGPDGHGREIFDRAHMKIGLGPLTWPHQLVRILLAEQLYRAATILAGHPYHRA